MQVVGVKPRDVCEGAPLDVADGAGRGCRHPCSGSIASLPSTLCSSLTASSILLHWHGAQGTSPSAVDSLAAVGDRLHQTKRHQGWHLALHSFSLSLTGFSLYYRGARQNVEEEKSGKAT